ncbi:MAG: DUF3822 family protein [Maribacter sp.]
MIKETINKNTDIADKVFKKLSIQVSLNGLSFCVTDSVSQKLLLADASRFNEEKTPMFIKGELQKLFEKHALTGMQFEEVIMVHSNTLFGLVPKSLFNPNQLLEYLKFNTKVFPTDALSFDEVENQELVNVYVPYMNLNNYVYELFGAFTYMHNGTIILQSLLNNQTQEPDTVCYIHVALKQMDITVIEQRKLILYNSFNYETKEDFVYYILFVLEQLDLDPMYANVKLFGTIEEDGEIFKLCYTYIRNLSICIPSSSQLMKLGENVSSSIDFTLANTL